MGSKLQNEGFKNSSEAGGDSRLTDDTKVYTQSKSKSLYQAIVDGDLGPKQNLINQSSGIVRGVNAGEFVRHTAPNLISYQLPTAAIGIRASFLHDGPAYTPTFGTYLTSGSFPNTTSLYGWRASGTWTTVYGGLNVSETGTTTTTLDHTGVNSDCGYTGSQYQTGLDSAWGFTGAFSFGQWLYQTDWKNISGTQMSIGGSQTNGFYSAFYGSTWEFNVRSGGAGQYAGETRPYIGDLTPGWHHFVAVRDTANSKVRMYIDGIKYIDVTETAPMGTDTNRLEIGTWRAGSFNWNGRITDTWLHIDTAWTDAQALAIYNVGYFTKPTKLQILPASGDRIMIGNKIAEYPGNLSINKKGVQVDLMAIDATTWIVNKVVANDHLKNTTIGDGANISLVGRDSWLSKTTVTRPRSQIASWNLNNYGYISHGYDGSNIWGNNYLDQHNSDTNSTTVKASGGTERRGSNGWTLNGYGYTCAGYVVGAYLGELNKYTDSSDTWATKASYNTISAGMQNPGAFLLNGYGYMCFGDGNSTCGRYNDNLDSWTVIAAGPTSRGYMMGAPSLNGYGYLIGGGGSYLSEVNQYNDSGNTWILRAPLTFGRYGHSSMPLNGYIVTCRGVTSSVSYGTFTSLYSDSTNTWAEKSAAIQPGYFGIGYSIGGYGYNGLGDCGTGSGLSSAIYQYN